MRCQFKSHAQSNARSTAHAQAVKRGQPPEIMQGRK